MKYILIFSFFISNLISGQDLDNYLWKNRFVVLFDGEIVDSKRKEQQSLLKLYAEELIERDVIVLIADGEKKSRWLKKYNLKSDFEGLILIGKDGGIKLQEEYLVEPLILFSLIDSMPMRKGEIKRTKKG